MAKVPGFAKVYAGRWAHRRNGHQATFANAAGFFNNLGSIRQPVPINLKGGGERRWPRCMPAKDKPRK